jgi:predicted DCC family thiol-disulfide oxidoreductase YuxK
MLVPLVISMGIALPPLIYSRHAKLRWPIFGAKSRSQLLSRRSWLEL